MLASLKELWKYRLLLRHLVLLDIKVRYRGSFFGFLWTLINPLLLMLVLWFVFSGFGAIKKGNYALFLLAGIIAWQFFQQSTERALNCVIAHRGIIQKIYLPKLVLPVSIVCSNVVNMVFFVVAYLIIAAALGELHLSIIYFPISLLMLFLLSVGSALTMSTLNIFYRDFTHLTAVLMRVLFYLTPVIYPPERLGPKAAYYFQFNPVYYPVIAIRDVLYHGKFPDTELLLIGFSVASIVFIFGLYIFSRNEHKFVYYV